MKQRFQQLAGPFIQRFSRPSHRWTDSGREPVGIIAGLPAGACVLPRTRALFTRLDMADIPQRQRREAVLLELEQHAPFEEPRGWVLWRDGLACVWYWPLALEQQALAGTAAAAPPTLVPEPALWPALAPGDYRWLEQPAQQLYLLQYQHPRSGLYEKRYPAPIGAAEAAAWLQRHGAQLADEQLAGGQALQPTLPPALAGNAPTGESLTPRSSSLEQRVFPATAALLVFLMLVYTVAIARAEWETSRAHSNRLALQAEVADVIELRNTAATLQAANRELAGLSQPSQLALAGLIADTLDISSARLLRWAYRNNTLELSWQTDGDSPDATWLIRELETLPVLSDVQAQVNTDGVVEISMTITGTVPPIPTGQAQEPTDA